MLRLCLAMLSKLPVMTIRNIQHSNINITIGSTNKHIAIRTIIKK